MKKFPGRLRQLVSLDFKNQAYFNDQNTNNSVEVITDWNIFTQHFVQSSFFSIQDCCRKDRQWKMFNICSFTAVESC